VPRTHHNTTEETSSLFARQLRGTCRRAAAFSGSEIMNEKMTALGFKFNIGDVLMHVGMAGIKLPPTSKDDKEEWFSMRPKVTTATVAKFVVCERIAQECPGGIQLKYLCTGVSADGHTAKTLEMHQHELMPIPV
jgi:hypothetical protein